jgi:hypothetical protein
VADFEVENPASYMVEQALDSLSPYYRWQEENGKSVVKFYKTKDDGVEYGDVLDYPGIRFDELYAYLRKAERRLPPKEVVGAALRELGFEDERVHNRNKVNVKDDRERRWFRVGSKCDMDDAKLKLALIARTELFSQDDY